jgi:hypothetical protein
MGETTSHDVRGEDMALLRVAQFEKYRNSFTAAKTDRRGLGAGQAVSYSSKRRALV